MELDLLLAEIDLMETIKAETIKKILYEVEWYFELNGEQIPLDSLIDKVNEQIEMDFMIYNVVDIFYEDCIISYEDLIDELFNSD